MTVNLRYVAAPEIAPEIIYRRGLSEKLRALSAYPLLIVNTSAGYGKTVLLRDYSLRYLENDCWFNCPFNITSPAELTLYLINSVKRVYPGFGQNAEAFCVSILNDQGKQMVTELAALFLNEIISLHDQTVTLIIDDYQNLEGSEASSWVTDYFNEIFLSIPANIRFVILTRQKPQFKISRLEAKRHYAELNTADLAFTFEETKELFGSIYKKDFSAEVYEKLLKVTAGWITALHVLAHSSETLENISEESVNERLYDLFEEDIFDLLDQDVREFLLSTSMLESFSPDLCNKLLGISDSTRILEKIESRNFFIERFKNGNEIYFTYQKLFLNFITEYKKRYFDPVKSRNLLYSAARLFEESGDFESSIRYYLRSEKRQEAVRLMNNVFDGLYKNSEYGTLSILFGLFEGITKSDGLLLNFNQIRFQTSINKIAEDAEEKLGYISEVVGASTDLHTKCCILGAEMQIINGRPVKGIEILHGIMKNIPDERNKAWVFTLLCKGYYRAGFDYYDELLAFSEEAIEVVGASGSISQYFEVINLLAGFQRDRGNEEIAIRYCKQALERDKNMLSSFRSITTLSSLYLDRSDFTNSMFYLEKAKEVYSRVPIPLFQRLLLRTEEYLYVSVGIFTESLKIQEEILRIVTITRNHSLIVSTLFKIIESCYYLELYDKALQTYEHSQEYLDAADEYLNTISAFCRSIFCSKDISVKETEVVLLETLHYHEKNKIKNFIPPLEFYLSKHYLLAGNSATSIEYLRRGLGNLKEKNNLVWCSNELNISRPVFDFAISNNICKQFINEVFLFTFSKAELPFLTPEFRAELEERNKLLIDIKMLPFGRTDFLLRGKALEEDKWTRKKSKILLAYLMADPKRVHTKDEIIDMFFGDAPADKADTMYHSTMYNIRTALKIYDIKSDAPKRSKHKPYDYNPEYILYGDKTLRLNADFYYESDNVRFEKLYEKFRLPLAAKDDRIKSAIAAAELYAGDFLPGYYESWCEELRIKYKNMFATLMTGLIELLEPENRIEEIVKYSERLLTEDSLNEAAYLAAIKAYANMQNINMAKSLLAKMLRVFDEELGEKPSSKTLRIISEIVK
jgi:DNA-binding SARP family transcriptional activator